MADKVDCNDDENNLDAVSVDKNNVYFYTDITPKTQHKFYSVMRQALDYISGTKANPNMLQNIPVILHINSPGGYAESSFAIYDYLKSITAVSVRGIVEGMACSGASIMLLGCSHRDMTEHSVCLIHEMRSGAFGKYSHLKDSMENNDIIQRILRSIYLKETTIREVDIDDILSHDIYWDRNTCKKYGIITED